MRQDLIDLLVVLVETVLQDLGTCFKDRVQLSASRFELLDLHVAKLATTLGAFLATTLRLSGHMRVLAATKLSRASLTIISALATSPVSMLLSHELLHSLSPLPLLRVFKLVHLKFTWIIYCTLIDHVTVSCARRSTPLTMTRIPLRLLGASARNLRFVRGRIGVLIEVRRLHLRILRVNFDRASMDLAIILQTGPRLVLVQRELLLRILRNCDWTAVRRLISVVVILAVIIIVKDHFVALLDQLIVGRLRLLVPGLSSRVPLVFQVKVVFSESLAVQCALLKLLFLLACLLHHILEAQAVCRSVPSRISGIRLLAQQTLLVLHLIHGVHILLLTQRREAAVVVLAGQVEVSQLHLIIMRRVGIVSMFKFSALLQRLNVFQLLLELACVHVVRVSQVVVDAHFISSSDITWLRLYNVWLIILSNISRALNSKFES